MSAGLLVATGKNSFWPILPGNQVQSKRRTDVLRGVALLGVVLAAYLAQYLWASRSFSALLPQPLVAAFPFLSQYFYIRAVRAAAFALWVFAFAAIGFGLLTPSWRAIPPAPARFAGTPTDADSSTSLWRLPLAAAGLLSVLAASMLFFVPVSWPSYVLILLAAGSYLWAGVERERFRPSAVMVKVVAATEALRLNSLLDFVGTSADGAQSLDKKRSGPPAARAHIVQLDRNPIRGWRYLVVILAVTTVAYLFRWLTIPSTADRISVRVGLLAQGHGTDLTQSASDVASLPMFAATFSTLFARLTGDGLVGVRLAGLYAGLLLVLAIWLLAAEIFQRPAAGRAEVGEFDEDIVVRIVASSVAAFGLPALYFAHGPAILEGVVWGSFGLWALLYGLRLSALPVVGLSAVLLGVSALYGPNGLTMIGVGIAVWSGAFVVGTSWQWFHSVSASPVRRRTLLYWLLGLAYMLLPLAARWAGPHADFRSYLLLSAWLDGAHASHLANTVSGSLQTFGVAMADVVGALLAPSIVAVPAGVLSANVAMLSLIIAPFYILGLGALALDLDGLTAWVLAMWLLLASALSVLYAYPLTPHWSALIVMWPAVSLTVALALDRLRAAIYQFTGDWTYQAALYLVAGLVGASVVFSWLNFQELAASHIDSASALGREVRRAQQAGEAVLVVSTEAWNSEELATIAFLSGTDLSDVEALTVSVTELPDRLAGAPVLVAAGDDRFALERVGAAYPSATVSVYRDLVGNPVAYSFRGGVAAAD